MFASMRMKRGNLRYFRRVPFTRLQNKHTKAILCEVSSKRSAARARADNDEVVLRCFLFWVKSRVSQLNEDTPQPSGAVF